MSAGIIFATVAGPVVGYGHAVRVAAVLRAMHASARVCCEGDAALFVAGYERISVSAVEALVGSGEPVVVVVDHPDVGRWHALAAQQHLLLAVIDDGGGPAVAGDIVINCSAFPAYHQYPALGAQSVTLLGLAYVPLRAEFSNLPPPPDDRHGVVIVAGSGARAQQWITRLLGAARPAAWGPVVFIVSPAFDATAVSRARHAGVDVRQHVSAGELVAALRQSTLCVTTAGVSMLEAFACGIPVIAWPVEDDMIDECAYYHEQGWVTNIGAEGGSPERIAMAIDEMLSRPERREAQAQAARAMVDGRGARRIAEAIERVASEWIRTGDRARATSLARPA